MTKMANSYLLMNDVCPNESLSCFGSKRLKMTSKSYIVFTISLTQTAPIFILKAISPVSYLTCSI